MEFEYLQEVSEMDKRLTNRMIKTLQTLSANIRSSIIASVQNVYEAKAIYRMLSTEPLPPKGGRFNQRLKPPKVDRIPTRRYLLFSQQFFLSTQVSIFCYLHNVIFMSYVQYDDFL